MLKNTLLVILCAVVLISCKDDDEEARVTPVDTVAPVITLESPTEGQTTVANGTQLRIKGSVADNVSLQEVHVELLNRSVLQGQDPEVIHYHLHIHSNPVAFDTAYTFNVTEASNYQVKIRAVDHNQNAAEVNRDFTVAP